MPSFMVESRWGDQTQQGGGMQEPPNCNGQCKAAIDKALAGNPLNKNLTGWDLIEQTGEIGTGDYEGLPKARFQDWVALLVEKVASPAGNRRHGRDGIPARS